MLALQKSKAQRRLWIVRNGVYIAAIKQKKQSQLNSTDISSKRVEKNTILLLNRKVEENLEIKTIPKCLNFGTIAADRKFEILKSNIFDVEDSFSWKYSF